ncbi:MAG: hypothetical protein M1819_005498 [Sarea resinae]|nr:MAG: hypothetical protein M1819_005498 [Sarea resinae]
MPCLEYKTPTTGDEWIKLEDASGKPCTNNSNGATTTNVGLFFIKDKLTISQRIVSAHNRDDIARWTVTFSLADLDPTVTAFDDRFTHAEIAFPIPPTLRFESGDTSQGDWIHWLGVDTAAFPLARRAARFSAVRLRTTLPVPVMRRVMLVRPTACRKKMRLMRAGPLIDLEEDGGGVSAGAGAGMGMEMWKGAIWESLL